MWSEHEYILEGPQRLIHSKWQPQAEVPVAYHEIDMNNNFCSSQLDLTKQHYCLVAIDISCRTRHIKNEEVRTALT
jgi:hypothetical protein